MRAVLAGTGGRLPVALGVASAILLMMVQPWVDQGAARFVFWPVLGAVTSLTTLAIVRRLHAMGHSGAWAVLVAIPLVGIGLLLWMMVGARGGPMRPIAWRHGVGLGLIALTGLFVASRALWQPFAVQGDSMAPAVQAGDYMIATRNADVARGSVVIFRHPVTEADHFFRIIGLPGDEVSYQAGRLFLNGMPTVLKQEPDYPIAECRTAGTNAVDPCAAERFTEQAEGLGPYQILDLGDSPLDNMDPITVPEGRVFVLGDNRDNALDSRVDDPTRGPGLVPVDAIHGQAIRVAFNTGREGRIWVPIP